MTPQEKSNARVKRWREANRERVRDYSRRRWADDPEARAKQKARRSTPGYRDKEREYQRARRRSPKTWAFDAIRQIRLRCKKNGIPFDLTADDIVVPELCPILNVPLVFGEAGHPHLATVDRFIPALGYVKGNVAVISRQANTIKSDCTDPEVFRRLADWMELRGAGNALALAQAVAFVESVMEVIGQ